MDHIGFAGKGSWSPMCSGCFTNPCKPSWKVKMKQGIVRLILQRKNLTCNPYGDMHYSVCTCFVLEAAMRGGATSRKIHKPVDITTSTCPMPNAEWFPYHPSPRHTLHPLMFLYKPTISAKPDHALTKNRLLRVAPQISRDGCGLCQGLKRTGVLPGTNM